MKKNHVCFIFWLCLRNWRRQCCDIQCFGQAFLGPMPDGTKGAVRSHCSSQILNSGQYRSVRQCKSLQYLLLLFFKTKTELHAFYEKGITYLFQSFSQRQPEAGKNGNIILLSLLRDKRGKTAKGTLLENR